MRFLCETLGGPLRLGHVALGYVVEEGGCGIDVGAGFACIAVAEDSIDIFSCNLVGEISLLAHTSSRLAVGCAYALS